MRGAFCTLGMPQTSTYTSNYTSNAGPKFTVIPSEGSETLMDAVDPGLSAGKNVGGEHMKKRHFVLFRGQFFTNFAHFYYNWDSTIET